MKRSAISALLALCGLACGCQERFDAPDTPAGAPAANITIASLHALYRGEPVVVREPMVVGGTVVSSDEAGNFHRTLVLDDGTGGAEFRIDEYNLHTIYPMGRCLTVSLQGCALSERNGVLQIGLPSEPHSPYPTDYISSRVLRERIVHRTDLWREAAAIPCTAAQLGAALCGRLVRIDGLRLRPDPATLTPTWGRLPPLRRHGGARGRRLHEWVRPLRRQRGAAAAVFAHGHPRIRHSRQLRQTVHSPDAR